MKSVSSSPLLSGRDAEDRALAYLCAQGLKLIERNYRCRLGEIDLIMEEGDRLIFVEVRYRADTRYGTPMETVNQRKRTRLIAAASHYLSSHRLDRPTRFDVIGIEPAQGRLSLQWIKDAFSVV